MNKQTENLIRKIPGWLEINEGRFLEYATKQTTSLQGAIVEIGSFCGKSTICLAQEHRKVYAIDPHKGYIDKDTHYPSTYTKFRSNLKKAGVLDKVVPLVHTSKEAAKKWNKPIGVLFIDGLHDEENAAQDFDLWSPYVMDHGIILMHDSFCRWCGSEKIAVNKIIKSDVFYKIGKIGSIIYGIKGKGTKKQQIIKYVHGMYLRSRIQLNHAFIILTNLSSLKNKIQPQM